jgi:uncharacterized protein (TIGR01777 family)
VGSELTGALVKTGHKVTILTRSTRPGKELPPGAEFLVGDPSREGPWQDQLSDHHAIINLAGASIFTRWTKRNKELLRKSRLKTTENLVKALSKCPKDNIPRLLSTSAVGFYGFCGDEELSEQNPPGNDFLAQLSLDWETEALKAEVLGSQVALLRFGVVLGRGQGALAQMIPLFKKYLGSPLGTGVQWFSWIHIHDLVSIYLFLLERDNLQGPFNCTAPNPVQNRELTKVLAETLEKPAFLPPVPGFAIRAIMGEFGNVLLKGQRVLPQRLLSEGFQFQYPTVRDALKDLLQ